MKKNIVLFVIILTMLMNSFTTVYAAKKVDMLKDKVSDGILTVVLDQRNAKTKVMIEKDSDKYYYDLLKDQESFPLQLGSGKYTVSVLENTSGNKYKVLTKESFTANITNVNSVYLESAQPIKWDKDMEAIKLATSMAYEKTDEEIVGEIYNYIVNNIKYDSNKISTLSSDYVPDIDKILTAKKGICYDYSVLMAAMLRSQGVPTKLIKGYRDDIKAYHAWNEVYLNGRWIVVDTTYDSWSKNSGQTYNIEKNADLYDKQREF